MRGHHLIVAVVALGASACFVFASGSDHPPPVGERLAAANGTSDITDSTPDLQVELPIEAAEFKSVQYRAAVPGFELAGAKLDPDGNKTRAMVGIRFLSRTIGSVRVGVQLLDSMKERNVRHQAFREEQLGPERVVISEKNIGKSRNWNDYRALWFDFPSDARECRAIRVTVHLRRLGNAAKATHIVVRSVKPKGTSLPVTAAYGLTQNDYRHIVETLPNVRETIPIWETARTAQVRDQSADVQLIATTEKYAGAHAVKVHRGRFLVGKDLELLASVAVISREAARQLFVDEDPIGKSIRIGGTDFLVVGVVADGSAPLIEDDSANRGGTVPQVFAPLSMMQSRLGDSQTIQREGVYDREQFELSRIEITVDDPAKVDATAEALRRRASAHFRQNGLARQGAF